MMKFDQVANVLVHDTYYLAAVLSSATRLVGHFYGTVRASEPKIYHTIVAGSRELSAREQPHEEPRDFYPPYLTQLARNQGKPHTYKWTNLPLAFFGEKDKDKPSGLSLCQVDGIEAIHMGPLVSFKIRWIYDIIEKFPAYLIKT